MEKEIEQNEIECLRIKPSMVDALWEKCEPILSRSIGEDINFHTLSDIREQAKEDNWQLWMVTMNEKVVGSFCTNIAQEGSAKIVNMFNFAGDYFPEWGPVGDLVVANFCKEQGALGYQAIARKGFSKFIPNLKPIGEIYFRKVAGE